MSDEIMWVAPDLDDKGMAIIDNILEELDGIWHAPRRYTTRAEIDAMTPNDAAIIRIAVRRMLVMQLIHQERHMHELDDCGDYLTAATDNWATLYSNLFNNDFQNEVEETQKFLTDFNAYPLGGCDGEIRHDMLSEELMTELETIANEEQDTINLNDEGKEAL